METSWKLPKHKWISH